MPATYPAATRVFNRRPVDREDIVFAADVLELQDEIVAIEDELGANAGTSTKFPDATSVAHRLTLLEYNFDERLDVLETVARDASISVVRASSVPIASGLAWQPLTLGDVIVGTEVNDFDGTTLYDAGAGRFFSVAPDPARWSLSVTVTWAGQAVPDGRRGLRIIGSDGRVFTSELRMVTDSTDDDTMSVHWTGRLLDDPTYYLRLQVLQDSGAAVDIRAHSNATPTRADFSHLPG